MQSTGRAIAINHAERAFPSCVETAARWWRFSKSLWRDVSEWCSSVKTQGWLYALKICSESKRKSTTGKYEIEPARRVFFCQKLRKISLKMDVTLWSSSLWKRSYKLSKFNNSFYTIWKYFDCDVWDLKQKKSKKTILLSVESRCQTDLKWSMQGFERHQPSKQWLRRQVPVLSNMWRLNIIVVV